MENNKTFDIENINCDDYTQVDFLEYRGDDLFEGAELFDKFLQDAIARGYMLYGMPVCSSPGPEFQIYNPYEKKSFKFLNFCSYNYLGYSTNPVIKEAVKDAIDKYGTGAVSAPMLSGYYDVTSQLESSIAEFKGKTGAVVFPTGYGTNLGVISAMLKLGDVAVLDILSHASIYDGARLSGADIKVFSHNNAKHLDKVLSGLKDKRVLVCVEGVYSMDGDLANLPKIVEVCKKHNVKILLDEAHSTLIFGEKGRGVAEHFNVENDIDITIGTFSKAFGAIGGYAVGEQKLMTFIKMCARSYIFSCGMAPHTSAGILKVLECYQTDKTTRTKLFENSKYIKDRLLAAGLNIGETESHVVPVIVGDDIKLREVSKRVFERGLYTGIVTFPAVSSKRTRLRLSISSEHTKEHLDRCVDILTEVINP